MLDDNLEQRVRAAIDNYPTPPKPKSSPRLDRVEMAIIMLGVMLIIMGWLAGCAPVQAHTEWANGVPVTSDMHSRNGKNLCCGEGDCHMIDPGRIVGAGKTGLIVNLREAWVADLKRYNEHSQITASQWIERHAPPAGDAEIPEEITSPSPDGRIWLCWWGGEAKCFFVPMGA